MKRERTVKKTRKRTPKDDVWDAICLEFGMDPSPKIRSHRTRLGRLATDLTALGATESEIKKRALAMSSQWGAKSHTPEALVKHWDQLGAGTLEDKSPKRIAAKPGKYDGLAFNE
ncbi:MAG: hypothetical protein GY952_12010 [Rhodobacteraceae bacterium]|nr:hypothetical protein [Paracoccaceae bacterium]